MRNENHAFAEGDAEYWGLKLTDETKVFTVFNGSAEVGRCTGLGIRKFGRFGEGSDSAGFGVIR